MGFWGGDCEGRYGELFMGKNGWIVGFWRGDFGGRFEVLGGLCK